MRLQPAKRYFLACLRILTLFFCISATNAGFWRKNLSQKSVEKKLKIDGDLDFTADFGLKVSQVTAGFGYGEGYYFPKPPTSEAGFETKFSKVRHLRAVFTLISGNIGRETFNPRL